MVVALRLLPYVVGPINSSCTCAVTNKCIRASPSSVVGLSACMFRCYHPFLPARRLNSHSAQSSRQCAQRGRPGCLARRACTSCAALTSHGIAGQPSALATVLACSRTPSYSPTRRDRLPNRLDALAHQRHVGPALLPRASRTLHLDLSLREPVRGARGHTRLHRLGRGECLRDYRACCGR